MSGVVTLRVMVVLPEPIGSDLVVDLGASTSRRASNPGLELVRTHSSFNV